MPGKRRSSRNDKRESKSDKVKRYILDRDSRDPTLHSDGDVTRRFKYLLQFSHLFRYFIDLNALKDPKLKQFIKQFDQRASSSSKSSRNRKKRQSERDADAQLLEDENLEDEEESQTTIITETPSYISGGQLRPYQIEGLNWMISLDDKSLSGILADEMGLGKTLQTISFLGYLRYYKNINGPFMVIVPKSTMNNWKREFEKWTPEVNVLVLQGSKEERQSLIKDRLMTANFDVVICSYEIVLREKASLKKLRWEYLIIDEAHRIKNEDSSLAQIMRILFSRNRLLITGTPLQNNLHELWALLNFILPDVFGNSEVFDEWFESQSDSSNSDQDKVVQQLHTVLSPFILRRVKADVEKSLLPKIETNIYVGMTDMQVEWYRKLLEKDIAAVHGMVGKREGKTRLLNIVMQLRKCCNHPYLFDGAEPGPPFTTDEHLVYNAGKMIVLEKMLKKFEKEGSRVLIFCQMSRLLDILEDYCFLRDYEYCRIDGSTSYEDRTTAIDDFNAPNSNKFIFLLTTRAGGLGINLTTADVVILYDSDWNPQADLQAMDRAHRIGQKKQVKVYRMVTQNAVEEKVLEKAAQKLRLDRLVIQDRKGSINSENEKKLADSKGDLIGLIQHGAERVFESQKGDNNLLEDDIETIMQRGAEKTASLNAKYDKLGLDDIQHLTFDNSTYEWNGEKFSKRNTDSFSGFWSSSFKRERKEQTYSIDGYYKDVLRTSPGLKHNLKIKAPKVYNIQEFHFAPKGLKELLEREQLAHKKESGFYYTLSDFGDSDEEFIEDEFKTGKSREERRNVEQTKIDEVIPLSEEELESKDKMLEDTFITWTRRDFNNFVNASAKFGRSNYKSISNQMGNKTEEEVEKYLSRFWNTYKEIDGFDRYAAQIEASEKKLASLANQQRLLELKMKDVKDPLADLKIIYPPNNSKRLYSKLEDQFILTRIHKYGLQADNLLNLIKQDILASDLFRFDWYFLSRTSQEIGRRVNTLMLAVTREMEGTTGKKTGRTPVAEEINKRHESKQLENGSSKRVKTEI